MLQAVFSAEFGDRQNFYPEDYSGAEQDLGHMFETPEPYYRDLEIERAEGAALAQRARIHKPAPYNVACQWAGSAIPVTEGKMKMTAKFTRPLYSEDGQTALVDWWLTAEPYSWAHGYACVVRRKDNVWKGKCLPSWLT
ncbi:MAG: hypothetical protein ACXW3D_03425 [Caulobacteraceae bacterium]